MKQISKLYIYIFDIYINIWFSKKYEFTVSTQQPDAGEQDSEQEGPLRVHEQPL